MNENELKPEEPIVEDWKDKYLRAIAEMENMRKRMQKEKQELTRFSTDSVVAEFLPALDNFENALRFAENASLDVKNWAIGFTMILSQFKEVLHDHGIIAFHAEGTIFNPESHEAVEIEETLEVPDGTIIKEFSKGYKSSLRIVRPARVKVAKHPQQTNPQEKRE